MVTHGLPDAGGEVGALLSPVLDAARFLASQSKLGTKIHLLPEILFVQINQFVTFEF